MYRPNRRRLDDPLVASKRAGLDGLAQDVDQLGVGVGIQGGDEVHELTDQH